jgi:hypothetical protein
MADDVSETARPGDDLNRQGRPPVRPLLYVRSGDANQGGEMEVLVRELDKFDAAFLSRQRILQRA